MTDLIFRYLISQQLIDLSEEQLDKIDQWFYQEGHCQRFDHECQRILEHYQTDDTYDLNRAFRAFE